MSNMFSSQAQSTAKWAMMAALCLAVAGCGGSGGDSDPAPQGNTVGVAPAQADYDAASESFDKVTTASTPDGNTVLSPADIAAAQAEIDRIGDKLLAL